MNRRLPRPEWLHAALVAATLFALYAATAPRTVALEDDGLFVLSSRFLGVEHPPGYPLYTLLGKVFTLLPIGSAAYRVHLLSAALGALACGALWLCARRLVGGTMPAYVAAYGLGLSAAFWSQAIIAEVYTLNTLFVFALLLLALRAAAEPAGRRGAMYSLALVFGLSLANHWPLMLLVAPGFAILLWPRGKDILRLLPVLATLILVGLAPYAWLIVRSWDDPPVSFYGPLESAAEVWVMLSRAGYGATDVSPTATWLDRAHYLGFLGRETLAQFAVIGTALAGVGFALQWRAWGPRVSAALAVVCLMPSVVLLFLLGFDYDELRKVVYRAYPLPAYGVLALWMALGLAAFVRATALRQGMTLAVCGALLAAIASVGARSNLRHGYDWSDRYARAVLTSLPPNAVLFVDGDAELGTIAYARLAQGMRPDVTIYHPGGLVLGNRLRLPLRTPQPEMRAAVLALAARTDRPVAFVRGFPRELAGANAWLYVAVDRSAPPGTDRTVPIAEPMERFLDESVLAGRETDGWTAFFRNELRRRIASHLASTLSPGEDPPPPVARRLAALAEDFHGLLGIAEGMLANSGGHYPELVARHLASAERLMPPDATKSRRALLHELRAYLELDRRNVAVAREHLEASVALLPTASNRAVAVLEGLYAKAGEADAIARLHAQIAR